MASTCVRLFGTDVDTALLKADNIATPDNDQGSTDFSLRSCPACKLDNPPTNTFRSRCGTVVDGRHAKEIVQQDLDRDKADGLMDRLIDDREFGAMLERKLREVGNASG